MKLAEVSVKRPVFAIMMTQSRRGLMLETFSRNAFLGLLTAVAVFLVLGWASEVQLRIPATLGSDAPIGFFNAWSPVHAYYAVYGILQAWFAGCP